MQLTGTDRDYDLEQLYIKLMAIATMDGIVSYWSSRMIPLAKLIQDNAEKEDWTECYNPMRLYRELIMSSNGVAASVVKNLMYEFGSNVRSDPMDKWVSILNEKGLLPSNN